MFADEKIMLTFRQVQVMGACWLMDSFLVSIFARRNVTVEYGD